MNSYHDEASSLLRMRTQRWNITFHLGGSKPHNLAIESILETLSRSQILSSYDRNHFHPYFNLLDCTHESHYAAAKLQHDSITTFPYPPHYKSYIIAACFLHFPLDSIPSMTGTIKLRRIPAIDSQRFRSDIQRRRARTYLLLPLFRNLCKFLHETLAPPCTVM